MSESRFADEGTLAYIAELEAQDTEMCEVHAQLLVEHGKAKLHIATLTSALKNVREWFESESKSISKGNGSQWSKLQCDEQIATIDEVLK